MRNGRGTTAVGTYSPRARLDLRSRLQSRGAKWRTAFDLISTRCNIYRKSDVEIEGARHIGASNALTPGCARRLYDDEINADLESDWDGGFRVCIGNSYSGHLFEETFLRKEFEKIADWLEQHAQRAVEEHKRNLEKQGWTLDPRTGGWTAPDSRPGTS